MESVARSVSNNTKQLVEVNAKLQEQLNQGGVGGGATEAKQDDIIIQLAGIDISNGNIDNKISNGNDFTLSTAQQVLVYGEVTSGPGTGELHPIHITNSGDVEVEIADFVKGQDTSANSFPVVIASDQTAVNSKLVGEDYLGTNRNIMVDTAGKLIVQIDGARRNGSETIAIPDGTTGTSSEILMGTDKFIAFYGDTDNTINTNIFIEYSQDGVNWFRGAGDNAKVIVVASSGNFYDEEHVTPPRVRIARPNTSGANETLQLYYTLL
jgi:hypothetical protein